MKLLVHLKVSFCLPKRLVGKKKWSPNETEAKTQIKMVFKLNLTFKLKKIKVRYYQNHVKFLRCRFRNF